MSLSAAKRIDSEREIPAAPKSGVRLRAATPVRTSEQRRARTGHDHHFLSRLSRVSSAEIEIALSLYRNADLVKAILASPLLPKHENRVAVSLDRPKEGPFVIIARDAHFVTCLARGMSLGTCPSISRDEVETLRARLREEKVAECQAQRIRECWERRHPDAMELAKKFALPTHQKKNLRTLLGLTVNEAPKSSLQFVSADPNHPFLGFDFFTDVFSGDADDATSSDETADA